MSLLGYLEVLAEYYYRQLTTFASLLMLMRIFHLSRTNRGQTIGCRQQNGNL